MRLPRVQLSVKQMMVVVAALAVPVAVIAYVLRAAIEHATFDNHANTLMSRVWSYENRPPDGMDPVAWRNAVGWTVNAIGNTCVDRSISNREMARIVLELEARFQGKVGPETLLWVWDRMGRANRYGRIFNRHGRIQMLVPLIGEALRRHRPDGAGAESWRLHVQTIEKKCRNVYDRTLGNAENGDGPRDEAEILLDDLGRMLHEAESPGFAERIMHRLELSWIETTFGAPMELCDEVSHEDLRPDGPRGQRGVDVGASPCRRPG